MADKAATKKKFFEKMKEHLQKKEAAKLATGSDELICLYLKIVWLIVLFREPKS